jgi:hypothetical protein
MVNNKHEDFVLVNDSESGIIMLGCEQNLIFFCSDVEIFADGTFKCCPKYFSQLFMVLGTDIISHLCFVCCRQSQENVTEKCLLCSKNVVKSLICS